MWGRHSGPCPPRHQAAQSGTCHLTSEPGFLFSKDGVVTSHGHPFLFREPRGGKIKVMPDVEML